LLRSGGSRPAGHLRVCAGLDSASWAGKPCPTMLLACSAPRGYTVRSLRC